MSSLLPKRKNSNKAIWSVVKRDGAYIAQVTEANSRARFEGWTVVATGLTVSQACEWKDAMNLAAKTATPVLTDLFTYDYSDELDNRGLNGIQEFDVVSAQCRDGIWRTGSVITWNTKTVVIEVGNVMYRAIRKTAELVCKVDDSNFAEVESESWTVEYNEYRDETDEPYEIQTFAGMVA